MQTADVTILGLGNMLMQDEGIGVYIASLLIRYYRFKPAVKIIDGGTTGIDLLPYFERSRKILIIDAVNFKRRPCFTDVIRDDDILHLLSAKMSLHHLGLADVLGLISLIGIKPEAISLLGIQPCSIDIGTRISEKLQKKTAGIIEIIKTELNNWQIVCEGPFPDQSNPDNRSYESSNSSIIN